MEQNGRHHTFFLIPVSRDVGLTSMALGLVRALQLAGVKVSFVKPIIQPGAASGEQDLSSHFARHLCGIETPDAIPFEHAAEQVREGQLSALMEEVVANVESVRGDSDVTVVEGLIPDVDFQIVTRLNIGMVRSLSADIVPVLAGANHGMAQLMEKIASAIEQYGDEGRRPTAGVLTNHCSDATSELLLRASPLKIPGLAAPVPVFAAVRTEASLSAPRMIDVAEGMGLGIINRGDIEVNRVANQVIAARSCEKLVRHLRPGTLVITPADRSDAILTTALIAQRGMPIAGFVLTCGGEPAPEVTALLQSPPLNRLPILGTSEDTFQTATRLAHLSRCVGRSDTERMDRVLSFMADAINIDSIRPRLNIPVEQLMSPPVFRHRMVELARAANKRIVLPEGDEPRTLRAAAICVEKRIARCVLLGNREKILAVAAAHGIDLPGEIEIMDPETSLHSYVGPMVEMRKHKGLTPLQAEKDLEDTVVLGTMMLALGEVDGLVSGAVHTTANTVRPALQLIKTAPGSSIVSSVFFMLMPDQVFVYGDCAINPDPTVEELAEIAIQSADSAAAFGIPPRVAMISYSTGSSGSGKGVDKVREATAIVKARRPDLVVDGPIQYDAAAVESVGKQKAPGSPLAGHANVFIFPDLNTGNTTYKAVQRAANLVSVGPMLQGLRKPVNDLSRGALVDDIVYTIALTAIQSVASDKARKMAAE